MKYSDIKGVLLDIEGTTTSISFVKDILFPSVRENLDTFLENHWMEPEILSVLKDLYNQSVIDKQQGLEGHVDIAEPPDENATNSDNHALFLESVAKNVKWQMLLDRKTKSLKELQGLIWENLYKDKKIYGHIYDDVPQSLMKWKEQKKNIYIYSSGSVYAQKLLFKNSNCGDLSVYIDDYFDLNMGQKRTATSYLEILKRIKLKAEFVLFLTDIPAEAYAAQEAGLNACIVVRENNLPLNKEDKDKLLCITTFMDLDI